MSSATACELETEPKLLTEVFVRDPRRASLRAHRDRSLTMQSKLLAETAGQRTYAIVLETGEDVFACLSDFAERETLTAAHFSAIGAFRDAVMSYFDWDAKDYLRIPVQEQVEVATLHGDVALAPDDSPAIHIHAVLGRKDGSAVAGHLAAAHVRPTLEIILTESPAHLRKKFDPESGLALIRPEEQR